MSLVFGKNPEAVYAWLCVCEYLKFSGVRFLYVSPHSQKLYDPPAVTVSGFKPLYGIPACSVWHKLYDVELHKRQDWNSIWFYLLKIICELQLLRKMACFQISHKPPCSFHTPQRAPVCLLGARTRPLFRVWGFGYPKTCVLTYALYAWHSSPLFPLKLPWVLWIYLQSPLVVAGVTPQQNIGDICLFSTFWFRAFIIWGKTMEHLTDWHSANVPECGFYDYKFNQPF